MIKFINKAVGVALAIFTMTASGALPVMAQDEPKAEPEGKPAGSYAISYDALTGEEKSIFIPATEQSPDNPRMIAAFEPAEGGKGYNYYSNAPRDVSNGEKVTVRVVDKDNVPVTNAEVRFPTLVGSKNRGWSRGSDLTNGLGEVYLYNYSKLWKIKKPVNKFPIAIYMIKPHEIARDKKADPSGDDHSYVEERFNLDLSKKKDGDVITLKLKNKTTQTEVQEQEGRLDVYIENSMGGAVQNMRVSVNMSVPQTIGYDADSAPSKRTPDFQYVGYTDKTGRVTFLDVREGRFPVYFGWRDGGYKVGNVIMSGYKGYTELYLNFDEALLDKMKP